MIASVCKNDSVRKMRNARFCVAMSLLFVLSEPCCGQLPPIPGLPNLPDISGIPSVQDIQAAFPGIPPFLTAAVEGILASLQDQQQNNNNNNNSPGSNNPQQPEPDQDPNTGVQLVEYDSPMFGGLFRTRKLDLFSAQWGQGTTLREAFEWRFLPQRLSATLTAVLTPDSTDDYVFYIRGAGVAAMYVCDPDGKVTMTAYNAWNNTPPDDSSRYVTFGDVSSPYTFSEGVAIQLVQGRRYHIMVTYMGDSASIRPPVHPCVQVAWRRRSEPTATMTMIPSRLLSPQNAAAGVFTTIYTASTVYRDMSGAAEVRDPFAELAQRTIIQPTFSAPSVWSQRDTAAYFSARFSARLLAPFTATTPPSSATTTTAAVIRLGMACTNKPRIWANKREIAVYEVPASNDDNMAVVRWRTDAISVQRNTVLGTIDAQVDAEVSDERRPLQAAPGTGYLIKTSKNDDVHALLVTRYLAGDSVARVGGVYEGSTLQRLIQEKTNRVRIVSGPSDIQAQLACTPDDVPPDTSGAFLLVHVWQFGDWSQMPACETHTRIINAYKAGAVGIGVYTQRGGQIPMNPSIFKQRLKLDASEVYALDHMDIPVFALTRADAARIETDGLVNVVPATDSDVLGANRPLLYMQYVDTDASPRKHDDGGVKLEKVGEPERRSLGEPERRSLGEPERRSLGEPERRSLGEPESAVDRVVHAASPQMRDVDAQWDVVKPQYLAAAGLGGLFGTTYELIGDVNVSHVTPVWAYGTKSIYDDVLWEENPQVCVRTYTYTYAHMSIYIYVHMMMYCGRKIRRCVFVFYGCECTRMLVVYMSAT
jgi:hypothetical protein